MTKHGPINTKVKNTARLSRGSTNSSVPNIRTIRFLGLDLHCISYQDMFKKFDQWINASQRRGHSVALINVNCCVSGLLDRSIRTLYQRADLLGIDSMPFLYVARLFKNRQSDRLYAPDMMLETARVALERGYKFFLYGGSPGAPEAMSAMLKKVSPDLEVVGTYSPPFRELTEEEDNSICQTIIASGANILWVGLGSPKQDVWIARHCQKLPGCVLIASGATFDFFSGRIRQAPPWIRTIGLEWLFRLSQDPIRLWKRYTVYNVVFGVVLLLELIGVVSLDDKPSGITAQG
jgi:N-acetylglucosaminyldiphosphoundecaprenol N-acetyl-beta-D-mannosaminyltransferase